MSSQAKNRSIHPSGSVPGHYYPPRILEVKPAVGFASAVTVSSVYMWTGKGPALSTRYAGLPAPYTQASNSSYLQATTEKRFINKYISPKVQAGNEFPLAHCPSDEEAYDYYGNSYTGNYFWGGAPSVTKKFWTLLDPTDPLSLKTVKGAQVRSPATFIIAGENAGVSKPYNDTINVRNFLRVHNKKVDRWNMLFADGHSGPIDINTMRVDSTQPPTIETGWTLAWKIDK